ncbi:MAG TPA: hypothetical protein VE913_16265, partial [Longimicrobium sp.]|nr:hypothetical protein [Longimicrobium sp.]
MNTPFARARRLLRVMSLGLLACASACDAGEAVIRSSDEPLLYVVLNQRTPVVRTDPQRAFLLTAGSAVASSYRVATRFEMRRRSDGRAFAWRSTGRTGVAPGDYAGAALHEGNYFLPDVGGAEGLGALDLRPGETYDLEIETEGVPVRGSVTVPASFSLTFGGVDGRTVSWPRVRGAGGYTVEAR